MIQKSPLVLTLVAALMLVSGTAWSQFAAPATAPSVSPIPAQKKATIYRLGAGSGHSEGCIPPCLCPVFFNPNIKGTFTMRAVAVSPIVQQYAIEQVNWTVDELGTLTKVKGSGVYTRTSTPLGKFHEMELELTVGGAPAVKFVSGTQPDPNTFPSIDISVGDGDFCYARSFIIDSDPAPKKFIQHYMLSGTTFQEGCYPPCLCPITVPRKVKGSFDLVLLEDLGTIQNYSITNVDWKLSSIDRFTGTGDYSVVQGFAGPVQAMDLCLARNGVVLDPFSSGGVPVTSPGTSIEVVVSQSGMVCFDRVFDITAGTASSLRTSAGVDLGVATKGGGAGD